MLPSEKKREWHTKQEGETNPAHGKYPHERTLREHIENGIVNIDKPRGPTSHTVVDWVKKTLKAGKAGHTGTLDPHVTGVLPTAIENATKTIQALLPAGKEYVCLMKLHKQAEEQKIKEVFKEFTGTIYQKPPLKSAVVRKLRTREIYYLDIIEIEGMEVLFRVGCEAGTYIRKLCHDIGLVLGAGANMQELRRTKSGPFTEETLVTLTELRDAYEYWKEDGDERYLRKMIQPVENAVVHLPKAVIHDSAVNPVCNGSPLMVPGIMKLQDMEKGELTAVFTLKGELVCLGRALMSSTEILENKKGMAVKTERVVMKAGTYPKNKKTTD